MKTKISTRIFTAVLLAVFMYTGLFPASLAHIAGLSTEAAAAAKASLSNTSLSVPIGSGKDITFYQESGFEPVERQLEVKNKVKGAIYSFTTINKSVVTINKNGVITGLKKGTATITCYQTYKGSKTKVGSCKVSVKEAVYSYDSKIEIGMAIGSEQYLIGGYMFPILFRNPAAKYTVVSSSRNLTVRTQQQDDLIDIYATAKKSGNYTLTVKETYNKKTRTIGTIPVKTREMEFTKETAKFGIGQVFSPVDGLIEYYDFSNSEIYFESVDPDIVSEYYDGDYFYWKANQLGTAVINVYADSSKKVKLGSYKVKIIEIPADELTMEETASTYLGDEYFNLMDFYISYGPYNTTDVFQVTIDNPEILAAEKSEISEADCFGWTLKPLAEGTTTVTVTLGSLSKTSTVTVYANLDDYFAAGN